MRVAGDNRVMNFCVQYPRDTFRVCCQTRSGLSFYEIQSSKKEPVPFLSVPLLEAQLSPRMEWAMNRCFLGTSTNYLAVDLTTGQIQQLFALPQNGRPLMACTQEDILLVSDQVGVFVDFQGKITRGSISWSAPVLSVSFQFPYLVALLIGDVIEVHNVYDQKLVQRLASLQGAPHIHRGELLLQSRRDLIYSLRSKPIQAQLEELIDSKKLQSALDLAKVVWREEPQSLRVFYMRVGIVWFTQGNYDQALPVLIGSSIDPRELIVLFRDLIITEEETTMSFKREYSYDLDASLDRETSRRQLLRFLEAKRNRSLPSSVLQVRIGVLLWFNLTSE